MISTAPLPGTTQLPRPEQNFAQIQRLEVPLVVRLGERSMRVAEVVRLVPGAIIELPKHADAELDLLVNNKPIGCGTAVKVGENFGLRVTYIGDVASRLEAVGGTSEADAAAAAEAMLAGQSTV